MTGRQLEIIRTVAVVIVLVVQLGHLFLELSYDDCTPQVYDGFRIIDDLPD